MPELAFETIRQVRHLLNGHPLSADGWQAIECDPGWPDYVLGAVRTLTAGELASRRGALALLRETIQRPTPWPWLRTPEVAQQLVAGLRAVFPDDFNPADHLLAGTMLATHLTVALTCYETMLLEFGPAALEPCRELLLGPPEPYWVQMDSNGYYNGIQSAKRIAIGVVARHGAPDVETPHLQRLLHSRRDQAWDRVRAGLLLHLWHGQAVADEVILPCLDPDLDDVGLYHLYLDDLAIFGTALVPLLIAQLGAAEYRVRHRALEGLERLRQPAVEPLVELIRTTADWRQLENAEEALGAIDRRALHRARQARRAESRHISLTRNTPTNDRGISLAGEPRDE